MAWPKGIKKDKRGRPILTRLEIEEQAKVEQVRAKLREPENLMQFVELNETLARINWTVKSMERMIDGTIHIVLEP